MIRIFFCPPSLQSYIPIMDTHYDSNLTSVESVLEILGIFQYVIDRHTKNGV